MLGVPSLWFAEHSHLPVGIARAEGGDGGDRYAKTVDPFVAMTAAAAATTTLKVATGYVWCPSGIPSTPRKKTRMRLLTERVEAMIEIWTKDEAEYHGQLVNFDLLQAWPKPVQTPHPPTWSAEPAGLSKTASSFGDGWAPMIAGIEDDVFDRYTRLQDRTGKPLELTASGPDLDRRTLARLAGPRCTSGARVATPGPRSRDQRQRHSTIPRRRRGQHDSLSGG